MLTDDFVLSPENNLTPAYRISPFITSDIPAHRALPFCADIDDYFRLRFPGRHFIYCESGRQAIHLALGALGLSRDDFVAILTTTGNLYVSGCVTREIEKFCRWSRQTGPRTKVLLVNHEFGFPYENLQALRKSNLPLIEDAAHSFASENAEQTVGRVGDFSVYSFPKFFPVQFGGLLVFNPAFSIREVLAPEPKRYLQKVLSAHLPRLAANCRKRQDNFRYLTTRFQTIGCLPRFDLLNRAVPGVFMFKAGPHADLPALKSYAQRHGIECSVFYGEPAFFLPVHDRLEPGDLDYFFQVTRSFLEEKCGT